MNYSRNPEPLTHNTAPSGSQSPFDQSALPFLASHIARGRYKGNPERHHSHHFVVFAPRELTRTAYQ